MFDTVVIGGGPGGYKCAELLARNKKKVALIEQTAIGGVCLNQGCIPFKQYLHCSKVRSEALKLSKRRILEVGSTAILQNKVVEEKDTIIHGLRHSVSSKLKKLGVELIEGKASTAKEYEGIICIVVGDQEIETRNLVIATGSREKRFLESDVLKYSSDMLALETIPETVVIIGAGAIGLEAASFFSDSGCRVTILEAASHIGGSVDSEVADALTRIFKAKGIDIVTGCKVDAIESNTVSYSLEDENRVITADFIMCATGRKPCIQSEILDPLNIKYSSGGIIIDEMCRTTNPLVFACGDVTGKLMLAHTAYQQARVISDVICNGTSETICYQAIPRVIYSNPEVLSVGLSEDDCKNEGMGFIAKSIPMTYSGRYYAENGKDGAIAKMIVNQDDSIVGFHMIGNGCSEFSVAAELMIINKMSLSEIKKLIFPHPTYCEIVCDLAELF